MREPLNSFPKIWAHAPFREQLFSIFCSPPLNESKQDAKYCTNRLENVEYEQCMMKTAEQVEVLLEFVYDVFLK